MTKSKFGFGTKGIWHKPASDHGKAAEIPCVVLEDTNGVLYIFTDKPIKKGYNNLSYRTATIFSCDFTEDTKN